MASTRMKEVPINSQGILEIDTMGLPESCVIILSNGKAKVARLPLHADTTIKTYKGKVTRVKWDEGEEF